MSVSSRPRGGWPLRRGGCGRVLGPRRAGLPRPPAASRYDKRRSPCAHEWTEVVAGDHLSRCAPRAVGGVGSPGARLGSHRIPAGGEPGHIFSNAIVPSSSVEENSSFDATVPRTTWPHSHSMAKRRASRRRPPTIACKRATTTDDWLAVARLNRSRRLQTASSARCQYVAVPRDTGSRVYRLACAKASSSMPGRNVHRYAVFVQ